LLCVFDQQNFLGKPASFTGFSFISDQNARKKGQFLQFSIENH